MKIPTSLKFIYLKVGMSFSIFLKTKISETAITGLTDLLPCIFLYFYFKAWYLWTSYPPNEVISFKSTSTSKPTKCMISIWTPMKINWKSCLLHRLLLTITKIENKCLINFKKSTIKLKDNQLFQILYDVYSHIRNGYF